MQLQHQIQLTDYQGSLFRRFTGKEKDSESGYYYFGARYFMPNLSIWNSVDPMADKYPSLSPYNYCAWNPMRLVDPNGDSIILSESAEALHKKYYNRKGSEEYTALYDRLQKDKSILFVVKDKNDNSYAKNHGADAGIIYDTYSENDEFVHGVFNLEWGDPDESFGGDASHVYLEEIYHAGQVIDNKYKNEATLDNEIDAKEFAMRTNPSNIKDTYTDRNGIQGLPTQLGYIRNNTRGESRSFLKSGIIGYPCFNSFGTPRYANIPPAYPDLR